MKERIIISGFGGQGIMFLGKLICQSAMQMGFNVTYIASYGAEVRGGTANCHVIISDKTIASPVIDIATTLIAMNEPSLNKFEGVLEKGGLLVLNSSIINRKAARNDIVIDSVPATDIAYALGDIRVANMVILGRYIAVKKIIDADIVKKNIKDPLGGLNIKAVETGYRGVLEGNDARK